jgi:amidohydrolase
MRKRLGMLKILTSLRKELHQHPEVSGSEVNTAKRTQSFIEEHHPTTIIENLGGQGFAAIYEFGANGPTVAIRCELDALPIHEENDFEHKSTVDGVSHKCGHDGHMTIVSGLVFWLKEQNFQRGKVVLLFQAAEETGKGAYAMLQDPRFATLNIDYLFALHNIPGEVMHAVIVMEDGFSAEVQSFSIQLTGKESHAAEPEQGVNPAVAVSKIIASLDALNVSDPNDKDFAVLTPVHLNLGQKAYGVSPANGEVHYTIRTWSTEAMEQLQATIETQVAAICAEKELTFQFNWFEHFPASKNNATCNDYIRNAAKANGLMLIERPYPFKFGEDFGWFSKTYKTAMFGLGSGVNTPNLHNANYDFPDVLIPTGVAMFGSVIASILES